ncbi:MAG: Rpn family recombination-promoting nuclease/putative transposase [Spirulina sp. SIO3F2]|nr:Rpn family recombination-promoting nuclease/putative transposase [Spirulina sp. SIO3F2]
MYDNFCKYLIETYPHDFANWLLGKSIVLTRLEPTELITEPIRADSLMLQGGDVVLHVEFQTQPDDEMPERMANYYLRIRKKFADKQIVQVVVYLRKTSSPLVKETTFQSGGMTHRFKVIRLWEQPKAVFWSAPGLLPLVILSKAANQDAEGLLEQTRVRIREVTTDVGMQGNLETATAIFAGLKLKLDVIKRIMRSQAMQESVFYQDMVQESLERGRREGREACREEFLEEGEQRGIRKGYLKLLRQLAPFLNGLNISIEPLLKRLNVTQEEVDAAEELDN